MLEALVQYTVNGSTQSVSIKTCAMSWQREGDNLTLRFPEKDGAISASSSVRPGEGVDGIRAVSFAHADIFILRDEGHDRTQ